MGTTLEKSIVVDRPVGWVYDQWTQLEDLERYAPGVERVEQLGRARIRATVEKRGVTREWEAVIVEQVPDTRIAWASQRWLDAAAAEDDDEDDTVIDGDDEEPEGPEHAGVVTFHQLDGEQTRVVLQFDFEPHGFLEWYADGVGLVQSWVDNVLEDFKAFVEDQRRPTGAWRGTIRDGEVVDDGEGGTRLDGDRNGDGAAPATSGGVTVRSVDGFTRHDRGTAQPTAVGSTEASSSESDRSGRRVMAGGEIRTTDRAT